MSASDYKKTIADTFCHIAVVGTGPLIINFGLEKGKIIEKTELKIEMRDAGKLFIYLSPGEFLRQKWWLWVGDLLHYCLYKCTCSISFVLQVVLCYQ